MKKISRALVEKFIKMHEEDEITKKDSELEEMEDEEIKEGEEEIEDCDDEDEETDEKLSASAMKKHKMALVHAKDMLGKAKVRYAKSKSADEKENLEFWKDRIISLTNKMKER